MIKIIAIILQAVAVAGGAYLGVSLKNGSTGGAKHVEANDDHNKNAHNSDGDAKKKKEAKKAEKKKKKKSKSGHGKSDGHGGGHGDSSSDDSLSFMKFSRQFIIPVVNTSSVNALVVMEINLELAPSATEKAYAREPKSARRNLEHVAATFQ